MSVVAPFVEVKSSRETIVPFMEISKYLTEFWERKTHNTHQRSGSR